MVQRRSAPQDETLHSRLPGVCSFRCLETSPQGDRFAFSLPALHLRECNEGKRNHTGGSLFLTFVLKVRRDHQDEGCWLGPGIVESLNKFKSVNQVLPGQSPEVAAQGCSGLHGVRGPDSFHFVSTLCSFRAHRRFPVQGEHPSPHLQPS